MKENKEISFENVHERRKRRKIYVSIATLVLIAYSVFLAGTWIVVRSPLFRVKSLSVTGNTTVSAEDILDVVRKSALEGKWGGLKAALGFWNILTWPKGLSNDDFALLPDLKSVTVERDFGSRSVVVQAEERQPYGIWCLDQGGCWWFDNDGFVFRKAIEASGELILVVHDHSQANFALRSKILPDAFVANAFSIFKAVRASGLSISDVALNDISLEEMEVDVTGGPKMYFSLRFPADNDLAAIQDFISKPGFNALQYLDFRVENRVYYK